MPPPGLLFVFGEPGPGVTDEEFNDWYDNEHVPLRMAIPTIRRAIRWTAAVRIETTSARENGGVEVGWGAGAAWCLSLCPDASSTIAGGLGLHLQVRL